MIRIVKRTHTGLPCGEVLDILADTEEDITALGDVVADGFDNVKAGPGSFAYTADMGIVYQLSPSREWKKAGGNSGGDSSGGSGGGGAGMLVIRKQDHNCTANMTYAELRALVESGNPFICVVMDEYEQGSYYGYQYAESVSIYDDTRVDVKFEYHEALFSSNGRIEWASLD